MQQAEWEIIDGIEAPDPIINELPNRVWPQFPYVLASQSERDRRLAGGTPLFKAMYMDLAEIIAECDNGHIKETAGIMSARETLKLFRAQFE